MMTTTNNDGCSLTNNASSLPLSLWIFEEGGKPLFSTLTSLESARLAGVLQATRGTLMNHPTLKDLGDIHRLKYGQNKLTVLAEESVTLVALSSGQASYDIITERFLEFVYAKLLFVLTTQIHLLVRQNTITDLDTILCRRDARNQSREDLPENTMSLPWFRPITLVTASVQVFGPLPPDQRRHVSFALKSIGESVPNTVAALLCIGHELISIVQSSHERYQIQPWPDLDLLLNCIEEQNAGLSDLWLPICLPCISSTGFLHCFAHQLDASTNLTVAIVGSDSSTAQFQRYRNAALRMKDQLGLTRPASDADDDGYELVSYPASSRNESITLVESIHATQSDSQGMKHRFLISGCLCRHFIARRTFPIQGVNLARRRQQGPAHASKMSQAISGGDDDCTLWERYARLGLLLWGEIAKGSASSLSTTQFDYLREEFSFVYEQHSDYLIIAMGNIHSEL
jgi:hypothetical protein